MRSPDETPDAGDDRFRRTVLIALLVFIALSAAAQLFLAFVYSRGVEALTSAPAIGERTARVLARPIRLAAGAAVTKPNLEEHLRAIGYYDGCRHDAGCFATNADGSLSVWARYPELTNAIVRWDGDSVSGVANHDGAPLVEARIEPETMLMMSDRSGGRFDRASYVPVPFAALAGTSLLDAIVASEDRWFRTHHGLDLPRLAIAPLAGTGASTITMQVARLNILQDRRRTLRRKIAEIGVAIAIERVHSKDAILSAYINSVGLGAKGGRPIHGFGAAAREFFGLTDVRELTDLQAATLVALLNQPSRYLDHLVGGDDSRLRRQRNRVLRLMQKNFPERYSEAWVRSLEDQPVTLSPVAAPPDTLHKVSRHFLDHAMPGLPAIADGRIYLTLDPELQRIAAESVEQWIAEQQRRMPASAASRLQAALIATNPHTGEVLAMVGGRSYDESQLNRAVSASRQVGSILKPFDYLAAFERAMADGRSGISPDTTVVDEPTVFRFGGAPWAPANYGNDYAGTVTWRRALAESRNVAAVKVAAFAGFGRVARLWESASGQRLPSIFPSIALGSVQATPLEVATSYAAFATGGVVRPLRTITSIASHGSELPLGAGKPRRIASAASTEAVAGMMRAVFDAGTARGARAAGFTLDATGKTGTTNALRDAWFAGFSGDLLAVVWVGRDDDQSLGLTGAQAALPIWTEFMKRAVPETIQKSRRPL